MNRFSGMFPGGSNRVAVPRALVLPAPVHGGQDTREFSRVRAKVRSAARQCRAWHVQRMGQMSGSSTRREHVDRAEKRELVSTLHDVFNDTGVVVVAHYAGLSVADMTDLRVRMKDAGGRVKVAKNRLAKIALEGTVLDHMKPLFEGQTLIAYSDDPVSAPKVAVDFAKKNDKFVVLGGSMGETVLDADGVKSLASLPSLDELRAKIAGMLTQRAAKIAQVVTAPGAQVARVVNAYATKDEAA